MMLVLVNEAHFGIQILGSGGEILKSMMVGIPPSLLSLPDALFEAEAAVAFGKFGCTSENKLRGPLLLKTCLEQIVPRLTTTHKHLTWLGNDHSNIATTNGEKPGSVLFMTTDGIMPVQVHDIARRKPSPRQLLHVKAEDAADMPRKQQESRNPGNRNLYFSD